MFAFVVLDLVFQYQAKILSGKNVSELTLFCVCWDISQSLIMMQFRAWLIHPIVAEPWY